MCVLERDSEMLCVDVACQEKEWSVVISDLLSLTCLHSTLLCFQPLNTLNKYFKADFDLL